MKLDHRQLEGPLFALALGAALAGATSGSAHADEAKTRQVVAGPQYAASGLHNFFFGSDYRNLWTTPVTVEVLDLQSEAGGLAPVRRVGGQQTKGLALKGKDGRNYTFRGLDKDATELVEEELRGTVVERTLQDQMAAQHPASELIARALLDAAGIPCPPWRIVVMPDDPALGLFRKDFAGAVGMFADYPSAVSETNPGFRGITEIVDHATLYKKLEAGTGDAIDARALLKARLVDILMGDWDRHRKQWRWAKFPGGTLWTPIPEDRDQAFSRYEGYVLDRARGRDPRFQNLKARYPNIGGLTYNGWEQDRRLLVGLTGADFRSTALELRRLIGDDAIEKAVSAMPAEWARLDAARLRADLKLRRDALPEVAEKYYRHLADRVDVYMTDQPERVEAKRAANGDLAITVAIVGADGKPMEPYFKRVFRSGETEEVRLYALGGDDEVVVTGGRRGPRLRVVGGAGNDSLDAREGGNAKLSDSSGSNHVEGAGLDARPYVAPPPPGNAPWIPPRDWGSESWTLPWLRYSSDLGAFLGMGIEHRAFAFRKDPYASRQVIRAGYSTAQKSGKLDYLGEFERENRSSYWALHAYASGVDVLRFYGFGNETSNQGDKDFFRAKANQFVVYPSFNLRFGRKGLLSLGAAAKYTNTREGERELINVAKPYGAGSFGLAALQGVLAYDGRDSVAFTRRGVFLAARGTLFPAVWDVKKTFGQINGNVNGYVSAGKWLTFAVRAGGKKLFGDYPYMEAAALGGGGLGTGALAEPDHNLRGFRARRFIGDASLYGNADLRLKISRITLLLPGHWGLLGFVDSGRVWFGSENSNTWHTGVGGGIWLAFLNYRSTLSTGIAHSKENDLFYLRGEFTF
jgi:hypothetical protein